MSLTVYVPCRNNADTLPPVLRALRGQTRPADEYLFVDGGSTDGSREIAAEFGFVVLDQGNPPGLAAGRNVALAHATGDLLAGIDADVVVAPDYLACLERRFRERPTLAALCGLLEEHFRQATPDLWRAVHMPQHFGDRELGRPRVLFGCTTAARAAVLRSLGGWDAQYVSNYEDNDLTERLHRAGHETLYAPDCRAEHYRRDTLDSVLTTFWRWQYHPSRLAGHFESWATWQMHRLPVLWWFYRRHRAADRSHPRLALITLLLPWSMLQDDFAALAKNGLHRFDPVDLARLADRVLEACGAAETVRAGAGRFLLERARNRRGEVVPLDPVLARVLEEAAEQNLPPACYWDDVTRGAVADPIP
jgi:GT2 family glycosyltransferase